MDMDTVRQITAVNTLFKKEKVDKERLAKAHEQLQLQHAKLQRSCELERLEKQELMSCIDKMQMKCFEDLNLLKSLDEATRNLVTAREEHAEAAASAAQCRNKCEFLEARNATLKEEVIAMKAGSSETIQAMGRKCEQALNSMKEKLSAAEGQTKTVTDMLQEQHRQQMEEMMQRLMRETRAREEAEAELAKERSTLQASLVSLAGGPADPVASLKQRMWSLRHELDTVKSERDELKRICRR